MRTSHRIPHSKPYLPGRSRLANLAAAAWLLAGLVAIPVSLVAFTAPVGGGVTVERHR